MMVGIDISNKLINCLLFADDIVLLSDKADELRELLSIAKQFADRWNLKFNTSKSNVMVIGKGINKDNRWFLCDDSLEEVNEYKYLGYFISRSLTVYITRHIE